MRVVLRGISRAASITRSGIGAAKKRCYCNLCFPQTAYEYCAYRCGHITASGAARPPRRPPGVMIYGLQYETDNGFLWLPYPRPHRYRKNSDLLLRCCTPGEIL